MSTANGKLSRNKRGRQAEPPTPSSSTPISKAPPDPERGPKKIKSEPSTPLRNTDAEQYDEPPTPATTQSFKTEHSDGQSEVPSFRSSQVMVRQFMLLMDSLVIALSLDMGMKTSTKQAIADEVIHAAIKTDDHGNERPPGMLALEAAKARVQARRIVADEDLEWNMDVLRRRLGNRFQGWATLALAADEIVLAERIKADAHADQDYGFATPISRAPPMLGSHRTLVEPAKHGARSPRSQARTHRGPHSHRGDVIMATDIKSDYYLYQSVIDRAASAIGRIAKPSDGWNQFLRERHSLWNSLDRRARNEWHELFQRQQSQGSLAFSEISDMFTKQGLRCDLESMLDHLRSAAIDNHARPR